MGPFAMGDLAGLDVGWRSRKDRGDKAGDRRCALRSSAASDRRPAQGFYRYEPGKRTPIRDPEVEAIIVAASKAADVTRRAIGEEEILGGMLYPMINEGARILDEGVAARPGDIDIVWINGYGFPIAKRRPDALGRRRPASLRSATRSRSTRR